MPEQEILPPGIISPHEQLQQLEWIADLMDNRFTLPGTNIQLGLDAILGLLPVIGDTVSVFVSGYIVRMAHEMGVPTHAKVRMGGNIFIDWLIGLVPFVGDAFDIGWKANRKNIAIIKKYIHNKK